MLRSQTHKIMAQARRKRVRSHLIAARGFQYRYSLFLATFGFFISLVVGGVTLYLLNHNYQMFARAEMITSPDVVDNLYRELKLANEFIVSSLIAFVVFLGLMGIRLSHRIVVPVMLVQERMRGISRGDLKNARVTFRQTDEFQEFGETYNYMVESLRVQLRGDIEKLTALKPNEHNRDAVLLWGKMVDEKLAQLNDTTIVSADRAGVSHHAS